MSIPNGSSFADEFFDSIKVRSGDNRVDDTAIPNIPTRYMDPGREERVPN